MDPGTRRSFHIGRYHCVESIAVGPLGETFRAKVYGVAGLEKQYALKQIDAELRVDPEVRQRLIEAARLYATLDHERIARLTEIHAAEEALYLVMDLARGLDCVRLAAHLRARGEALPVEQAILIAVDVAEALQAAHRPSATAPAGVVHTGLTPAVIMVLGEGEARVSEFALAAALQRPGWETDDKLVPLLAYVAPECLAGQLPTAAADLWSLGAVIYELCTGNPLHVAVTATALNAQRAAPPSWDRLPMRPGLRELVQQLLASDPTLRPASASEARERLIALLGMELSRARAGLQSLARRALGRGLSRTGSFAAVAVPSAELPTLPPEPPRPAAVTQQSRRPGWAPPRSTALLGAIRTAEDVGPKKTSTLPGLGEAPRPEGDPLQMEMAELPPSELTAPDANAASVTERSFESIAFDEGVTAPNARVEREEDIDALETEMLEMEVSAAYDGPTLPNAQMPTPPAPLPEPVARQPLAVLPLIRVTPAPIAPPTPPAPPAFVAPPGPTSVAPPPPVSVVPPPIVATPSAVVPPASAGQPVLIEHVAPPAAFAPIVPRAPIVEPRPHAQRSSGVWIAGGLAGLGIAVAVLVAGERGGLSTATHVAIEPTKIQSSDHIEPGAEIPAKVEAQRVDAPKVDAPKIDAPKVDAPKVEAPKVTPEVKALTVAGQLSVRSTPPGAAVWIDGELRGVTPLSASTPAGDHGVVLALDGMKVAQQKVSMPASGAEVSHALEPAKLPSELVGSGGLKVRCHTTGELRIFVDGHDTGYLCPNNERIIVAPGTHKIGLLSLRTGETKEIEGEIADDSDHSTRIYVKY